MYPAGREFFSHEEGRFLPSKNQLSYSLFYVLQYGMGMDVDMTFSNDMGEENHPRAALLSKIYHKFPL